MSELSADEMINYLVTARIPLTASSVDFTPSGLVLRSEHRKATEALRAELSALDYENLKARYDGFVTEARAQAEAKEAAHPFNQPHARADFDHWAKMEYWTVDEGIALLLGRSPAALIWDHVKHIESHVIWQFARIREAAQRAVNWKTLHEGNRPGAFILWAKRFEYPVPQELEEKVVKFGHFMGDWYSNYEQLKQSFDELKGQYDANAERAKTMYESIIARWSDQYKELGEKSTKNHEKAMSLLQERNDRIAALNKEIERLTSESKATPKEKPLGLREGDTLRKLVIGLAMVAYEYDPKRARNEVTAEIVSDLAKRGLTISDDTVRKHLKESAELLPPAEAPERNRTKR
jgi:polyhydroxyalkanoate synthesis regulator phasin